MDSTAILHVLWATTRSLKPKGDPAALTELRRTLAAMLAGGLVEGFPPGLPSTPRDRDLEAWKDCAAAAGAPPPGPPPRFALLWPAEPGTVPPRPDEGHGLAWPSSPRSVPQRVIGPMQGRDGRERHLFLYDAIDEAIALAGDGDAAPGLFPRAQAPGAGSPAVPRPGLPVAGAARSGSYLWSVVFVIASVVLAGLALLQIYAAAEFARGAAAEMVLGTPWSEDLPDPTSEAGRAVATSGGRLVLPREVDGAPGTQAAVALRGAEAPVAAATGNCLDRLAGTEGLDATRAACAAAWGIAWSNQEARGGDGPWRSFLRMAWGPLDAGGQLSLLVPFLMLEASVLAIVLAAGLALRNFFFGALIDERHRLSLSRTQMLAWTVLLLGGYSGLSLFNIALGSTFVRDLPPGAEPPAVQLFPSMDPALWAVLGITAILSPYLSKVILDRKAAPDLTGTDYAAAPASRPLVPPAELETRSSPSDARWSDLVSGEEETNAGQVDVSRLQHLVITGLLLGGYAVLLLDYVRTIEGWAILTAFRTGIPVFAAMPPVDGAFLGLLVLSHGAYLAFKALPATNAGGAR